MKRLVCLLVIGLCCQMRLFSQASNDRATTSQIASTRYFSSGSAFNLQEGQAYYRNSQLLLNQASIGITKNWSVGVGLIPAFIFSSPTPIWVSSKVSTPLLSDNIRVAANGAVGTSIGDTNSWSALLQGLVTFSRPNQHLTISAGYVNIDDVVQAPFVNFRGSTRIGKRYYLLTENYVLIDQEQHAIVPSIGGRWVGQKVIFDVGAFASIEEDEFGLIPWVNLTIPLNLPQQLTISTKNTNK